MSQNENKYNLRNNDLQGATNDDEKKFQHNIKFAAQFWSKHTSIIPP